MANSEKFSSITDLYKRLLPAIRTKVDELKSNKIYDISELDIWEYCKETLWKTRNDLRIYEMVNDILFVDALALELFKKQRK